MINNELTPRKKEVKIKVKEKKEEKPKETKVNPIPPNAVTQGKPSIGRTS